MESLAFAPNGNNIGSHFGGINLAIGISMVVIPEFDVEGSSVILRLVVMIVAVFAIAVVYRVFACGELED